MIKKILAIIIAVISINIYAYAIEGNVKLIFEQRIDKAINILKNKKETNIQKTDKIFKIFNHIFDYNLMARLALGREWESINAQQKKEYVDSFTKLLKKSFIEKLKLYNNQKIVVKNFIKNKKYMAKLKTVIVDKDSKTNVIYKFYFSKKLGWIVYDVLVSNVSTIQSYREQFSDLLNNMDFNTFLKKINSKNISNSNV